MVCKAMEFGQFPLDKHKCYFMLTSCKFSKIFFLPFQNIFLTYLILLSSVGYDSEHMKLSGRYSYYRFAGIYLNRQRSKMIISYQFGEKVAEVIV